MAHSTGRIIVALFASNIDRIQMIVDIARAAGIVNANNGSTDFGYGDYHNRVGGIWLLFIGVGALDSLTHPNPKVLLALGLGIAWLVIVVAAVLALLHFAASAWILRAWSSTRGELASVSPDAVAFGKAWVTECLRAAYPLGLRYDGELKTREFWRAWLHRVMELVLGGYAIAVATAASTTVTRYTGRNTPAAAAHAREPVRRQRSSSTSAPTRTSNPG